VPVEKRLASVLGSHYWLDTKGNNFSIGGLEGEVRVIGRDAHPGKSRRQRLGQEVVIWKDQLHQWMELTVTECLPWILRVGNFLNQ
jgi:hypothetical protein